jgi:hypothetical protein
MKMSKQRHCTGLPLSGEREPSGCTWEEASDRESIDGGMTQGKGVSDLRMGHNSGEVSKCRKSGGWRSNKMQVQNLTVHDPFTV